MPDEEPKKEQPAKPTPAAASKPAPKPSAAAAPKKGEARPAGSAAPAAKPGPAARAAPAGPPAPEHSHGVPGLYSHLREAWKKPHASFVDEIQWSRMIQWRKEPAIVRVEHPTRLDRAHALGYKAKQGVTVVRVRVRRGGLRKRAIRGGRRPRRKGILRITMKKSLQRIAEERVAQRYANMEVLNSYGVGADGKHQYFETILVDPHHPSVLADPSLAWIAEPANRGRAFRGLTSAGKKGRGLRAGGKGAEKVRPSRRARIRKKLSRGRRTQVFTIGRPKGHQK